MRERNGSAHTVVTLPAVINGSSGDTSNATQSTTLSNDIFTISKIAEDIEKEKPPKIIIRYFTSEVFQEILKKFFNYSDSIELAHASKSQ